MSGLKPYPEYKISGVSWLGEIPRNWSVTPLRYLATIETGSKDTVDAEPEGEYPFYVRSQTPLAIDDYGYDCEAILTPGDGDVGNIFHHVTGKFQVHQRVYVLRSFKNIDPRFLYHYFSSEFRKVVDYGGAMTTVASLRRPMFTAFHVALPPLAEQCGIAAYLDHETAEIDAFIGDQYELIELLNERRAATITQAVTKGLDPDVPMKDSGIEWLGKIPGAWSVQRLKWSVAQIQSGTSVNAVDVPAQQGELGVLKTSSVYRGVFDPEENKAVFPEEINRVSCPVREGSLIVSRMNTPQLVGAAGYVAEDHKNLFLPDRLWQVRFVDDVSPKLVHYWTKTDLYRLQVEAVCMGTSSSMQNIGQDDFRNFVLTLPPKSEQSAIIDYLDYETAEIDAAIADAKEAIELSKERRAALISAAVTGKIDVRNHITVELGAA